MKMKTVAVWTAGLLLAMGVQAHVGNHPSIHDTMAGIVERLGNELSPEELRRLDMETAMSFVTDEERAVLASEFLSFEVDRPAAVFVLRHARQRDVPFWLEEAGFEKTDLEAIADGQPFEVWKKAFPAGHVGLGTSGFDPHRYPYFAAVLADDGSVAELTDIYPGQHRTTALREGAVIYSDKLDVRLESMPEALDGAVLLSGVTARAGETQLLQVFRGTEFPSSTQPDQVVLTWSGDPRSTQTVQWRTSTEVEDGFVQYQMLREGQPHIHEIEAVRHAVEDLYLANDPVIHRYTATREGLWPDTAYRYRVGSNAEDTWSDWAEFKTAPGQIVPFSFVYMGDAQNGLDFWGNLTRTAFQNHPDAAFYIMAGDLVNRGNQRDDWDSLFAGAAGVYDRRPVVPAIGNHECQGDQGPWMYLSMFDLPRNGPENLPEERVYALRYSNALFLVLDSNLPAHEQTDWIEAQLANTDATWKFVVYHHPAYSSAPRRDNASIRRLWGELFDKYHVDLALQGHDHAYLRTYPMRGEQRVDSPAEGTIYIVSVAGTKMYDQDPRDYSEVAFKNISTYQVLDITVEETTLTYRAYDADGKVHDEFVIQK